MARIAIPLPGLFDAAIVEERSFAILLTFDVTLGVAVNVVSAFR